MAHINHTLLAIGVTTALGLGSIALALEKTATGNVRDTAAPFEMRLEAYQAAVEAALNDFFAKSNACTAQLKLYAPTSGSADANGCVPLPSVPQDSVVAFRRQTCPVGWAPLSAANGRMIVGTGNSGDATDPLRATYSLNSVGGFTGVALTVNQIPSHAHYADLPVVFNSADVAARTFTVANTSSRYNTWGAAAGFTLAGNARGNTSAVGGGQPFDNRPPYLALLYCYKQ